jgi:hypothetical protein
METKTSAIIAGSIGPQRCSLTYSSLVKTTINVCRCSSLETLPSLSNKANKATSEFSSSPPSSFSGCDRWSKNSGTSLSLEWLAGVCFFGDGLGMDIIS